MPTLEQGGIVFVHFDDATDGGDVMDLVDVHDQAA
jgi:hypothetical protein